MDRGTMTVTARIRTTFADAGPLYAAVGVGDLAAERLRRLQAGAREPFHPKIVRDRVQALRGTVIALPATSRGFARDRINGTAQAYDQLAERGQRLLGRTRQRATPQQLVEQAQRRVRRARAARAGTAGSTQAAKTTTAKTRKTATKAATPTKATTDATDD
jgi:heparin binding hemagglutinin HbhA